MRSSNKELTIAFLRAHPTEAARALESLDPRETAALIAAVPGRVAAPVVSRLLPGFAARSVEPLSDESAVRLLRRLSTPAAASLLRHLDTSRRARLLAELPRATAVACGLLLRYPEDSIGALADTDVLTVLPSTPVRDVLARLRSARDDAGDFFYVVDEERRLRVCLRPATLLHATGALSVGALEPARVPVLPAQAAPRSVRDHPGWSSHSTLPVVDRDGRLIGALRQSVLMQALTRTPSDARAAAEPRAINAVAEASWTAVATLLQALVSWLPGSRHRGAL
jgi:Mg/Co/Ni transporter MgtE